MLSENKKSEQDYKKFTDYYLQMSIKGVDVISDNVYKLTLREFYFELMPRVEIVLMDDGLFVDKFPLEDNDEIEIKLSLNKEDEPIQGTFLVESHEIMTTSTGELNGCLIEIVAVLKNNNFLFDLKNRSFGSKKSSEVLREVAEESGFNTDMRIVTNDNMKWLQINESNHDFIKHVVSKSYLNDDDALIGYVDREANFVYTSLKTEASNEVIYETIYDTVKTIDDTPNVFSSEENEDNKQIIYFNDFQIYNISPIINKKIAYGSRIIYNVGGEETIVDSKADNKPFTINSNKNKDNIETISNVDIRRNLSNNVFENYFTAINQNNKLRMEYLTSYIRLDVRANNNYKLMQKVNVSLPALLSKTNDHVNSGEYLIGGIIYDLGKNSTLRNVLLLYRNGVNAESSSLEDYETKLS